MPLIASSRRVWTTTAPSRDRIDWPALRERTDLAAVATHLMGPASGRRGERSGRRLWWNCPFHEDRNPSFCINPGRPWWRCFGCHEKGDAAALVMRVQSMSFPEAVRWLADFVGGVAPTVAPRPRPKPKPAAKAPSGPEAGRSMLSEAEAMAFVEDAQRRLWRPEGSAARAYLQSRGLTNETTQAGRLGVVTRGRPGLPAGIVLPWLADGQLSLIKLRQPEGRRPKYQEIFRDRPVLYVARPILPGRPVVIAEGEFDALLLAQECMDWKCGVVTTGSASNRPDAAVVAFLALAFPWYVATDADEAGERAAAAWQALSPGRCRRLRPRLNKDWGDIHLHGFHRIRYCLAPLLRPALSWDELAPQRWGPALLPEGHPDRDANEPPGILADEPSPESRADWPPSLPSHT